MLQKHTVTQEGTARSIRAYSAPLWQPVEKVYKENPIVDYPNIVDLFFSGINIPRAQADFVRICCKTKICLHHNQLYIYIFI